MTIQSADAAYLPQGRENVAMRGNYMEISNELIRQPMNFTWAKSPKPSRAAPARLRAFMVIARNTHGRGKDSDLESMSYIGDRLGLRGLDTMERGMNRKNVRTHTAWLEEWEFVERTSKTGKMNCWTLGLAAIEQIKPQLKHGQTFKEYAKEEREREKEGSYRREMTQKEYAEHLEKPRLKYDFFQWPNSFEDVMGPNIPYRLYALVMKTWAETVGRINHLNDGYDRMFDWYASYKDIGQFLGISDRKTIKAYIEFAEKWGFLVVTKRGNKKTAYHPGPHLWRLAKTGDLSPAYRAAFEVETEPGYPALYKKADKKLGLVVRADREDDEYGPIPRALRERREANVG